jgi:hypothetical protein
VLHKNGMFMIAIFAISISCCLVAIGAFLLLTTVSSDKIDKPQQAATMENNTKTLKNKIAQVNEQIARLQNELKKTGGNAEAAGKISETINFLKSAILKLQENNSLLSRKILEINENVRQLDIQNEQKGQTNG